MPNIDVFNMLATAAEASSTRFLKLLLRACMTSLRSSLPFQSKSQHRMARA